MDMYEMHAGKWKKTKKRGIPFETALGLLLIENETLFLDENKEPLPNTVFEEEFLDRYYKAILYFKNRVMEDFGFTVEELEAYSKQKGMDMESLIFNSIDMFLSYQNRYLGNEDEDLENESKDLENKNKHLEDKEEYYHILDSLALARGEEETHLLFEPKEKELVLGFKYRYKPWKMEIFNK